jgi:hypothetical protein
MHDESTQSGLNLAEQLGAGSFASNTHQLKSHAACGIHGPSEYKQAVQEPITPA